MSEEALGNLPSARAYVLGQKKGTKQDVSFVGIEDTIGVLLERVARKSADGRTLWRVPIQTIDGFATGTDQAESDKLGVSYKKTQAETSLLKGRETPSASAIAIEGVSLARRGVRVKIDANSPELGNGIDSFFTPYLAEINSGTAEVIDRAGLMLPFELGGHPGFLEDVMNEIRSRMVFQPKIARKEKGEPIRCDRIPCGDATSGLRAAGDPLNANRFKLPTGLVWMPNGQGADADFSVQFIIPRAFYFTMNSPQFGFNDGDPVGYPNYEKALVEFTVRLHGLSLAPPSVNG